VFISIQADSVWIVSWACAAGESIANSIKICVQDFFFFRKMAGNFAEKFTSEEILIKQPM
jgi:hypothetical protein